MLAGIACLANTPRPDAGVSSNSYNSDKGNVDVAISRKFFVKNIKKVQLLEIVCHAIQAMLSYQTYLLNMISLVMIISLTFLLVADVSTDQKTLLPCSSRSSPAHYHEGQQLRVLLLEWADIRTKEITCGLKIDGVIVMLLFLIMLNLVTRFGSNSMEIQRSSRNIYGPFFVPRISAISR